MEENKTTRTPPLNPWPSGTYGHHVYDQFAQDMVQIHDVGGDGHLRIIADYMRGCCGSVQLRKLPVIHYGGLRQLLNNLGTTLKITWNT